MDIFRAYEIGYGHGKYSAEYDDSMCRSEAQRTWYSNGYCEGLPGPDPINEIKKV